MDAESLTKIAHLLGEARLAAQPVPDISPADAPQTIVDGYAVQAALNRYFRERTNGTLVGWKIGATTTDMQQYLGVDGPAYGRILSGNVYDAGAQLDRRTFCNPGIECEIAVCIGSDARNGPYTRETIGELVDAVLPAIEIVENRYGDFLARGTPTLVADDFFHKACILGAPVTDWQNVDLAAVAGRTLIDGDEKGAGLGADVMGHPLEAVAWLANTLTAHGESLSAGQIVLTGSVAPVIWLDNTSSESTVELAGLGTVSLSLT